MNGPNHQLDITLCEEIRRIKKRHKEPMIYSLIVLTPEECILNDIFEYSSVSSLQGCKEKR